MVHGIIHISPRFAIKLDNFGGGRHDGVVGGTARGEGIGGHFFERGLENFKCGTLEFADARDLETGVEFFEPLDQKCGG